MRFEGGASSTDFAARSTKGAFEAVRVRALAGAASLARVERGAGALAGAEPRASKRARSPASSSRVARTEGGAAALPFAEERGAFDETGAERASSSAVESATATEVNMASIAWASGSVSGVNRSATARSPRSSQEPVP